MKLNIYSIYDTASGLYSRPFFTQSDGEALRSFTDIASDAEHPIGKHPEDYTLFRLGIYDDNSGLLINEDNSSLSTALEIIAKTRNIEPDALSGLTAQDIIDAGNRGNNHPDNYGGTK